MRCLVFFLALMVALTVALWNTGEFNMGKATIISEQGAGLYTIQPEWNKSLALSRIAKLEEENTAIDARLSTIDGEITTAETEFYYASDVLQAAILNQAPESEIEAKQRDMLTKQAAVEQLKQTKSFLQLRKTANVKQIEFIQQMTATPAQVQAWCADYTEGLTGTVGTVEIGRKDTPPIINPGGTFAQGADGQLVPLMSQSPAATFYNLAMLPGAAKWKPRYRTGTAGNINRAANSMDIAIDPLVISGIQCDEAATLTGVPVDYMTCNASVFENGDSVLVEYDPASTAKVVGFVTNPRQCEYRLKIIRDDGLVADDTMTVRISGFQPDPNNLFAPNPNDRVINDQFLYHLQHDLVAATLQYDASTQEWIAVFNQLNPALGLWIRTDVQTEDGGTYDRAWLAVQYPRRRNVNRFGTLFSEESENRHPGDLITPGKYIVTMPFWHVAYYSTPASDSSYNPPDGSNPGDPLEDEYLDNFLATWPGGWFSTKYIRLYEENPTYSYGPIIYKNVTVEWRVHVKSSISFWVTNPYWGKGRVFVGSVKPSNEEPRDYERFSHIFNYLSTDKISTSQGTTFEGYETEAPNVPISAYTLYPANMDGIDLITSFSDATTTPGARATFSNLVQEAWTISPSTNAYARTFEVTTTITGSGNVWPPAKLLEDGESTTFKLTPDPGWFVGSVTGAGGTYNAETMEYTTAALTEAATVAIVFVEE